MGELAGSGRALKLRGEGHEGACQAALHVAGAAAVEAVVADEAAERVDVGVPAVAERHGVHVTDVDQARLVAGAGDGGHELGAAGKGLELLDAHAALEGGRQPCDALLEPALDESLDLPLVGAGVRRVDSNELARELPRLVARGLYPVLRAHARPHLLAVTLGEGAVLSP